MSEKVKALHGLLAFILGQKEVDQQLNDKISEVLSQVFKRVYDPREVAKRYFGGEGEGVEGQQPKMELELPRPNPPYCSAALANHLVEFFEGTVRSNEKKSKSTTLLTYLLNLQVFLCILFANAEIQQL